MRLDHLCDVSWTYERMSEVDGGPGRDGRIYGQGHATVRGRLSGTADWSNNPRIRDGFALPDARGAIHLTGGGDVLFELHGLSSLRDGEGVHVMTFETCAPDHLWLNDLVAIGEGVVDVEHARLAMRYYECVIELPLPGFRD